VHARHRVFIIAALSQRVPGARVGIRRHNLASLNDARDILLPSVNRKRAASTPTSEGINGEEKERERGEERV